MKENLEDLIFKLGINPKYAKKMLDKGLFKEYLKGLKKTYAKVFHTDTSDISDEYIKETNSGVDALLSASDAALESAINSACEKDPKTIEELLKQAVSAGEKYKEESESYKREKDELEEDKERLKKEKKRLEKELEGLKYKKTTTPPSPPPQQEPSSSGTPFTSTIISESSNLGKKILIGGGILIGGIALLSIVESTYNYFAERGRSYQKQTKPPISRTYQSKPSKPADNLRKKGNLGLESDNKAIKDIYNTIPYEYECELGEVDKRIKSFENFIIQFPESRYVPEALINIAYLHVYSVQCDISSAKKLEHLKKAKACYERMFIEYKSETWSKLAKEVYDALSMNEKELSKEDIDFKSYFEVKQLYNKLFEQIPLHTKTISKPVKEQIPSYSSSYETKQPHQPQNWPAFSGKLDFAHQESLPLEDRVLFDIFVKGNSSNFTSSSLDSNLMQCVKNALNPNRNFKAVFDINDNGDVVLSFAINFKKTLQVVYNKHVVLSIKVLPNFWNLEVQRS